MSKQIQSGISTFNEMTFPTKLGTRTLILKIIGFATIVIIGFDPAITEVRDIVVGMVKARFFMKATLGL